MKQDKMRSQGFTLIEVTIGIMFAAFIVLMLSITFVDLLNMYNKSTRLSQVKAASDAIANDIDRIATRTSPENIEIRIADKNGNLVDPSGVDPLKQGDNYGAFGRLCLNNVIYFWRLNGVSAGNGRKAPSDSLIRFKDNAAENVSSSEYCLNANKEIPSRGYDVLISRDTPLLSFEPIQGVGSKGGKTVPILTISATIGTDTFNLPQYFYVSQGGGSFKPKKPYGYNANGSGFKCGNKIVSGGFSDGFNKNCAFVEVRFTSYERGGVE